MQVSAIQRESSGAGLRLFPIDQQGFAAVFDVVFVDHHLGHTIDDDAKPLLVYREQSKASA